MLQTYFASLSVAIFQQVYYQDPTILFMAEDAPRVVKHSRQFIGSREAVSSTTGAESQAESRPKKGSD